MMLEPGHCPLDGRLVAGPVFGQTQERVEEVAGDGGAGPLERTGKSLEGLRVGSEEAARSAGPRQRQIARPCGNRRFGRADVEDGRQSLCTHLDMGEGAVERSDCEAGAPGRSGKSQDGIPRTRAVAGIAVVAIGEGGQVAVMAIGDGDRVRADLGRDGRNVLWVDQVVEEMTTPGDLDVDTRLAYGPEEGAQVIGAAQDHDRIEVGSGSRQHGQTIFTGVRHRFLVPDDASAQRMEREGAEDSPGGVLSAPLVDEPHLVEVEALLVVGREHAGGHPFIEQLAGPAKAILPSAGEKESHDVVWGSPGQFDASLLIDGVVRRSGDSRHITDHLGPVEDASKRCEHGAVLPGMGALGNRMGHSANLVCDLDGVLFVGRRPVPGARRALQELEARRYRILLVTNNATRSCAEVAQKVQEITGFPADPDLVVTSALAAAHKLHGSVERAYVVGENGLTRTLEDAGIAISSDWRDAEAVVMGLDRSVTYAKLRDATLAVGAGARFVATNLDVTFPTPEGLWPGGGSLIAAVAAATGKEPELAGKPAAPMRQLVRARLQDGPTWVVGDRPETDLAMGRIEGWTRVLVLTGVVDDPDSVPAEERPDLVLDSIAELPKALP